MIAAWGQIEQPEFVWPRICQKSIQLWLQHYEEGQDLPSLARLVYEDDKFYGVLLPVLF
jgi:hypothetical protein